MLSTRSKDGFLAWPPPLGAACSSSCHWCWMEIHVRAKKSQKIMQVYAKLKKPEHHPGRMA